MAGERQPRQPGRDDQPDELRHASGEVDEAEAAIVGGAGGRPDTETSDEELERQALGGRAAVAAASGQTERKGGPRFIRFLRASWAELKRVQWPDRQQVGQGTAVVLGFVILTGAYLGAADWVAQRIVDLIL